MTLRSGKHYEQGETTSIKLKIITQGKESTCWDIMSKDDNLNATIDVVQAFKQLHVRVHGIIKHSRPTSPNSCSLTDARMFDNLVPKTHTCS